jgi:putative tricarboxylic transport membrane protein
MYIGNIMLLVFNLPLVGVFASLTKLPPRILMPIVTAIMFVGVYSVNNSLFDVVLLIIFGLLGYAMKVANFSAAPLVIGFVLGETFEKSLRQSLILSNGDFISLVNRPISGTLFSVAAMVIIWTIYGVVKHKKKLVLEE